MPLFAHVSTPPISCPDCGSTLVPHGEIGFQWGHCCHPLGAGGVDYHIGDEIHWRRAADGSIPAWSYFAPGGSANIGDPSYRNLMIRESELESNACGRCGYTGPDMALEIVDGVIASVGPRTDLLAEVEIIVVTADGSQEPMPNLDRPMKVDVPAGRGPRRLVSQSAVADA